MIMEEALVYHQEIPLKNKRMNDYMQNIVSNNNNYKCECCPYGHHVNVDFVEFAKDISNSHNELQKIRRYQRKLERAQNNLLNKPDVYSTFPKESIILSNQLSCSSSDSNSSEKIEPNIKQIDMTNVDNKYNKSKLNDVVYIPNNLNDCTSRSSDDSNVQSLMVDDDKVSAHNTGKDLFKTLSSTKSNSKTNSYSSKSFVVSYEHLMSIREQMSTSLKRVQDLESEVKNIHNLRQKIDLISKENHQLKCELAHEKEINEINNTKNELNRKINEIASNWCNISDLPSQLLPNLERILNTKLITLNNTTNSMAIKPQTSPKHLKSKTTQTDVNGSVIIDTLSYFSNGTKDFETQINPEENFMGQKVRRRNFGVTVRPTHHHFSQQITPEPSLKSSMDEESLLKFLDWLKNCDNDIDKRIGVVIYNLLGHLFGNAYNEAIELLRDQFQLFSYNYKSTDIKCCQTIAGLSWDVSCQVNIPASHLCKGLQVQQEMWNRFTHMEPIVMRDCSTNSHRVTNRDILSQTDSKIYYEKIVQTDAKPGQDFSNYYKHIIERSDISSATDRYLIDDMIAEQIEKSIELIHNELKLEIAQSSKQKQRSVIDNFVSSEINLILNEEPEPIVNTYSEFTDLIISTKDFDTQTPNPPEPDRVNCQVGHEQIEYESPIVHTSISGDLHKQAFSNLKRCEITYSHFNDEESSKSMNQITNETRQNEPIVIQLNEELKVQPFNFSDQSDSASSSPIEATYYSRDGRIEYNVNHHVGELEDVNEIAEDDQNPNLIQSEQLEKLCMIIPNVNRPPVFPQQVQESCKLIALWMNDSTTTCSKDLNESLAIIRQFWFEITSDVSCDIQFYISTFNSFNPTLQERIINMTDSNGNTCLHYAVSEGRWPIVRLLLQTRQVNVNKTNNAGYTVLMLVAVSENIDEESLKMLISDSQIDKQSLNDTQQTALMIAASQGKTQLVQLLLEKGATVNIADSDGSTALMCACDNGHLEVVRLLLARPDIDTELEDNTGCNAMKIALDNSHKDIALLIFARNNLQKISQKSKRRSGSSSHPTSPLNQRKFK